jgi:hypothetical protein
MPSGESAWNYVETQRGSNHPGVPNLFPTATELFRRRYHKLPSFASNPSANILRLSNSPPDTPLLLQVPLSVPIGMRVWKHYPLAVLLSLPGAL